MNNKVTITIKNDSFEIDSDKDLHEFELLGVLETAAFLVKQSFQAQMWKNHKANLEKEESAEKENEK